MHRDVEGWLGVTAIAMADGTSDGRDGNSLLPWPSGAEPLAERLDADGEVICEIRRVPGRLESWLGGPGGRQQGTTVSGRWLHHGDVHWYFDAPRWTILRGRYNARLDATVCVAVAVGREDESNPFFFALDH